MSASKENFYNCLYFSTNSLVRVLNKMAEEEFNRAGLSPSHAFLLMVVSGNPGIGPKEAGEHLNLTPSTITRFVDLLELKGLLRRESEGKLIRLFVTDKGIQTESVIRDAWYKLYVRLCEEIGEQECHDTACKITNAYRKLEKK